MIPDVVPEVSGDCKGPPGSRWLGPTLGQEADHQLPEEGEVLVLVASEPLPQVPSIYSLDKGITCSIYI